jgi:sugar/nucleoside kinase (ribokinase family)
MMGCVGDDLFGNFIIRDFQRHGIDTSAMRIRDTHTTSLSIVLSDYETGNRTFVFRPGSAPHFASEGIDTALFKKARYFFICQGGPVIAAAVDAARQAGTQIFIDADSYTEDISALIPKIDIFVGSEFFYRRLFDNDDYETNCRHICSQGPHTTLFTFGEKGCVGLSGDGYFALPAFQVETADTVGAGDVFHGAFLAGLAKGLPTREAARFASGAAAIKCTRIGGRAGIPDTAVLEKFLREGVIDYTEIDQRVKLYERGLENV